DFKAVVVGGVVGGGGLDAAAATEVVDGEVDLGGIDHADVDDVGACREDAVDKGFAEGGGAGAHVASDDDHVHAGVGLGEAGEVHAEELGGGMAGFPGDVFVEGIRVNAADIVGFVDFFDHVVLVLVSLGFSGFLL